MFQTTKAGFRYYISLRAGGRTVVGTLGTGRSALRAGCTGDTHGVGLPLGVVGDWRETAKGQQLFLKTELNAERLKGRGIATQSLCSFVSGTHL